MLEHVTDERTRGQFISSILLGVLFVPTIGQFVSYIGELRS